MGQSKINFDLQVDFVPINGCLLLKSSTYDHEYKFYYDHKQYICTDVQIVYPRECFDLFLIRFNPQDYQDSNAVYR